MGKKKNGDGSRRGGKIRGALEQVAPDRRGEYLRVLI